MPQPHEAITIVRPFPARGRWVERAACRDYPFPGIFFSPNARDKADAIRICDRCPVRAECLEYALECEAIDPGGCWGIWGGLRQRDRLPLRNQMKAEIA